MNKIVERINWVNDQAPALNDANLNQMDQELDELDNRVISLVGDVADLTERAETAATNAETSAANASVSEGNALSSANSSADSALSSKSYAVGGTGTRAGEDTDNAKYYCDQAREAVGGNYISNPDVKERGNVLMFNGSNWVASGLMLTANLPAGDTSITFNHPKISTNSWVDPYTSIFGINPINMAVIDGSVTLEFNEQDEAITVGVVIKDGTI